MSEPIRANSGSSARQRIVTMLAAMTFVALLFCGAYFALATAQQNRVLQNQNEVLVRLERVIENQNDGKGRGLLIIAELAQIEAKLGITSPPAAP